MATTLAPPTGAPADEEPEKKKGKKKFLVVGLVLLLVVGGAAYKLKFAKKHAKDAPPVAGLTVTESQLTINLAGGHYLQVTPAIQLVKGADSKTMSEDTPELLDTVIKVFAGQPVARLSGDAGLAWAKAHLLAALTAEFPGDIYAIWFTNFVMQ
jgi:flagellar FliL protein